MKYRPALFSRLAVALCALLLLAPGVRAEEPTKVNVTIVATVPEGTGTVYLPGNLPELGPWDPAGFSMNSEGTTRTATLEVPRGEKLEFKLTQGAWDREALNAD
jgi:hypothetical protein